MGSSGDSGSATDAGKDGSFEPFEPRLLGDALGIADLELSAMIGIFVSVGVCFCTSSSFFVTSETMASLAVFYQ